MSNKPTLVTHDIVIICTIYGTPLVTDMMTLNAIFDIAGAANSNNKKILDVLKTARAKLFNMNKEF